MDYQFITVPFLLTLLLAITTSLPVDPKVAQEETIAIYVPYDIRYVPVEVPEKFLNVEPLNSKSSSTLEQLVLKKGDILNNFKNKEDENTAVELSNNNKEKDYFKDDDLVIVPLSTISDALKANAELKSVEKSKEELSILPLIAPKSAKSSEDDLTPTSANSSHKISKRQAQMFPFYRPVFRFSRVSSSRRRISRPFGNHAMVGYLSDRDRFPTVA